MQLQQWEPKVLLGTYYTNNYRDNLLEYELVLRQTSSGDICEQIRSQNLVS